MIPISDYSTEMVKFAPDPMLKFRIAQDWYRFCAKVPITMLKIDSDLM